MMKSIKKNIYFAIVIVSLVYVHLNLTTSKLLNILMFKLNKTTSRTNTNDLKKMEIFPDSITTYKWFQTMKHRFKDLGEEDRLRYADHTEFCHLNISALGPISVNKTKLKLISVEEKYPDVRGGFYAPKNCRARHKVAILVPYRDRETNLIIFLNHMHSFLKKQYLEYRIFIIEQLGPERFNKGSIYNVGFLESQRFGTWDCIVFQDVDLLPLDERILYSCPRAPTHMSPIIVEDSGYTMVSYLKLFGGVTVLTPAQFEAANGYSNFYWGWGAEDDDIFVRLQARRFPVLRYNQSIARYAALPHKTNGRNQQRFMMLHYAKSRFRIEGLRTVAYILVNATKKKLFTHIVADVWPWV